jgi:hypothetical protein
MFQWPAKISCSSVERGMFMKAPAFCLVLVISAIAAFPQQASNPVSNDDISKMLKAGVDPKVIKWVVDNSDGKLLDGSPPAIQKLKAAGAPQAILNAISTKARRGHLLAATPTAK